MNVSENNQITQLMVRVAVLETQNTAMAEKIAKMAVVQDQTLQQLRTLNEMLATSKGWRLGLLTAIAGISGGAGSFLTKWLGSGGAGTH